MIVAYLSRQFPLISETFVVHEIQGLVRCGETVRIISFSAPNADDHSEYLAQYGLESLVEYQPPPNRPLWVRWQSFIQNLLTLRPSHLRLRRLFRLLWCRSSFSRIFLIQLAAAIHRLPAYPEVLHCHFGTMGAVAAELKYFGLVSCPISTVFHGFDISQLTLNDRTLYSRLWQDGDLFLPVNQPFHDRLLSLGAPREKTKIYHLGVNLVDFPFEDHTPNPSEIFRFLSIGRLTEKKGHTETLHAFFTLCRQNPSRPLHLDIVGDGELSSSLHDLVHDLGLDDRVTLHGRLQPSRTRQLMRQAHCFVLPSFTAANGDMEGIPIVLMEAMALGIPVISTRHSGIPELISSGTDGLLVAERDNDALRAALQKILDDPSLARQMAVAARLKVETQFNHDQQIQFVISELRLISGSGL